MVMDCPKHGGTSTSACVWFDETMDIEHAMLVVVFVEVMD
jgi:hypothetical protein